MIDWLLSFPLTKLGFFILYWCPLGLCAYGYARRTHRNVQKDVLVRAGRELDRYGKPDTHYDPTDTIGSLIGRAIVTLLPIGNLLAALFDVGPEVFARFIRGIEKIFNQPLVPDAKGFETARRDAHERAVRPNGEAER